MGMAILAIGASGVVALQKVTVLGVTQGRNVTAATTLASSHIEALRMDATRWNSIVPPDLGDARLLASLIAPTATGGGAWVLPVTAFPQAGDPGLGLSDVTGSTEETAAGRPPIAYCTHLRVTPMIYDPTATNAPPQAQDAILMRVEVRTFWAKSGRDVNTECTADAVETVTNGLAGDPMVFGGVTYSSDDYGWVFLATAIRRNDIDQF